MARRIVVTLLVPAHEEGVDTPAIPPQHNCTETASGLDRAGAHGWIGSFDKPAVKIVPFGCRRSANLC